MSEFFEEDTHIVADSTKTWPYFDIPGCLKILHLSDAECSSRITHRWLESGGYSRHAVVQLALYTCPPFHDITSVRAHWINAPEGYIDGYIIDQSESKNGEQKQRKYPCRSVMGLIEALATALMHYESCCEEGNWWPNFERQRDISITFLKGFAWLRKNASRRGFTPKNPILWHNRKLQAEIQHVIQAAEAFTYDDYRKTYAPTNKPSDPRAHGRKYDLLTQMQGSLSYIYA